MKTVPLPPPGQQPVPHFLSESPARQLLDRIHTELGADFDPAKPTRLSRAPGRLDVMGGIADYTGSMVCEATLDRAASVALQERPDRQLQVFSFNLYDEHLPFTLRIPLDALAAATPDALRRDFAEPHRRWAGYMAGCLFILHEQGLIDLRNPALPGLSLAVLSTVPMGAGVSSSAAIEVATMMTLVDHFNLRDKLDALTLASLCQQVENRIVGAPCGIMDQVTSLLGQPGSLLRMICQPHELLPSLQLPDGIRVLGINTNVKHSVAGSAYTRTRCAAFMAHKIILEKMREMGRANNTPLEGDPMKGYLANLDQRDYKQYFRPYLPERMNGLDFLEKFGPTLDTATVVNPSEEYAVQQAADHHVLEARRVKQFVGFLEQAAQFPLGSRQRMIQLDKAGHLMYASHISYTNDALLGAPECDLLMQLIRDREGEGFYGAKITGGGQGGTVAILANDAPRADQAIEAVIAEYEKKTGKKGEPLTGASPGAWATGTALITAA
jgi:galactokinase